MLECLQLYPIGCVLHAIIAHETTFLQTRCINIFFMKLLRTGNIEVVKCCQLYFGFELPSLVHDRRATKFDKRYRNHSNLFCHMISRL